MINVSQNIRTAMTSPMKLVNGKMVVHKLNADPEVYTANDYLQSITLTQEGELFLSAVKSGTVKLIGSHHGVMAGLKVDISAEVLVDETTNTFEEIKYGSFYVSEEKVDLEKDTTTLTLIDSIGLMRKTVYTRAEFQYPATIASLIEQTASKFDLSVDTTAIANLPNADVVIPAPSSDDELELFEESAETTYRDILDQLAGATGCIARCKYGVERDSLELVPISQTSLESLDFNNLMSAKIKDYFGIVNTVNLAREPQEDNIIYPANYEGDRVEIRLTNNEVIEYADVDDTKRRAMVVPLYNALVGLEYTGFEAKTEGHGWYEVGDRITVIDSDTQDEFETIITYTQIVIAGSLKETLKSETPEVQNTDYSTAGSTTRTVWNVQLKTDKQQGEINALVQKTIETDETVQNNYTEFRQTIEQITQTVQKAGGTNLLKNSVGYDTEDGDFPNWTTVGSITAQTSPESINYGAISGNQFNLAIGSKITQRVFTATGGTYTFSARVKKGVVGSAKITLSNGYDDYEINLTDQTEYLWQQVTLEAVEAHGGYFDVIVENVDTDYLYITDLMLSATDMVTPWQQSSSEILNTQVALTDQGVKVKSNTSGDYVQITPLEFAGYSDVSGQTQKVFYLNRDTTKVAKIMVKTQITMPPIKVIGITSGGNAGWAFVKTDETW